MTASAPTPLGGRRALLVVAVAQLAYVVGIFNRTSLGVAGLVATERFHLTASQLSAFTVLQLAVYAAMQVPVGVLLDRFGPRALVLTGCATMGVAQLAFALVPTYPGAVLARVLLGMGDAMMFISVLRLVLAWYPPRQVPMVSQLVAQLGQLGAIGASIPLTLALRHLGWTGAFLLAAAAGLASLVLVVLVVRNGPDPAAARPDAVSLAELRSSLAAAWAEPGTRLGLWSHFTAQFGATVFALLWGFPFLVSGQGLSEEVAGLLLVAMTVTTMTLGPFVGAFIARHPYERSTLVLVIVGLGALMWGVVLLWPGRAPVWLLVLLVVSLALGGPGSTVGFDFARTFNPMSRVGSANGIVNVGGFVASLATMFLVGAVLDHVAPDGRYDLGAFRVAMTVQYLVWALGVVQILRLRRAARRGLAERRPEEYEALRATALRSR